MKLKIFHTATDAFRAAIHEAAREAALSESSKRNDGANFSKAKKKKHACGETERVQHPLSQLLLEDGELRTSASFVSLGHGRESNRLALSGSCSKDFGRKSPRSKPLPFRLVWDFLESHSRKTTAHSSNVLSLFVSEMYL